MLSRRNFVKIAGAIPAIHTADFSGPVSVSDNGAQTDKAPGIRSIKIGTAAGNFSRFVAMNAYDSGPKGVNGAEDLVRITLADGTEGYSVVGYSPINEEVMARMKALEGRDPFSFYTWQGDRITGVAKDMQPYFFDTYYAWIEGAVLDAIGKLKKMPVWKLFGESVRAATDVYDATMYFEEIALKQDVRIIAEIGNRMKEEGYRGIKMKLGRCAKWLTGEAGVQRDIDAFIALREAVGWNFNIMADANNGYKNQFDWSVKLMKGCAPYDMYWMEELFPDDTPMYLKLRDELIKDNFFIPIAEGETLMGNDDPRMLTRFDKYLDHGVYNFLQPDMRTYGFSNMIGLARKAMKYPHVKIAPHNWCSQMGVVMCLHASKICRNLPIIEDDRFFNRAIMLPGTTFRNGQYFLSDQPGWGVDLVPDFEKHYVKNERVIL